MKTTPKRPAYEPRYGCSIDDACREATAIAIQTDDDVIFDFNGLRVVATPNSIPSHLARDWRARQESAAKAYESSPEGQAAARASEADIAAKQAEVDELVNRLPDVIKHMNEAALVTWCADLSDPANRVGVTFNKQAVARVLIEAGYQRNAALGLPKEAYKDAPTFARYIIGQAIDHLMSGMGPHPCIVGFAKSYAALPR